MYPEADSWNVYTSKCGHHPFGIVLPTALSLIPLQGVLSYLPLGTLATSACCFLFLPSTMTISSKVSIHLPGTTVCTEHCFCLLWELRHPQETSDIDRLCCCSLVISSVASNSATSLDGSCLLEMAAFLSSRHKALQARPSLPAIIPVARHQHWWAEIPEVPKLRNVLDRHAEFSRTNSKIPC